MNCSSLIPALLLLTLPACGPEKDLADTVDPTTTTSTTEPEVTGSDAATAVEATAAETNTSETTATTGAPEPVCPNSDNFGCTVPPGCEGFPCGDLDDRFDADGCPRPGCSDSEPCPEGYVCYDTGDWGLCNASSASCDELEGECVCGQTNDCQDVAYCVPAEIGPPADCFAITDAAACLAAGCSEALFTLGERPEERYPVARDALAGLGHTSTVDYLASSCRLVLTETGLLPHANAGALFPEELAALRRVSASQGMMLESLSERLHEPGGPHARCQTKLPARRLATLEAAGELPGEGIADASGGPGDGQPVQYASLQREGYPEGEILVETIPGNTPCSGGSDFLYLPEQYANGQRLRYQPEGVREY